METIYKKFFKESEYYNLSSKEINRIVLLIKNNEELALNFFTTIYEYTMRNEFKNFTKDSINFYYLLNNKKYNKIKIYRGETGISNYNVGDKLLYKSKHQYSSWTFNIERATYFSHGPLNNLNGVIFTSVLPENFIDLKFIFSFLLEINTKIGILFTNKKLKTILNNQRPFGEEELLVFGSIKATVSKVINNG